jgi:UDP-N-acetylmuramoyl-L-alanyl-D-glutamate--2,6-diaminopimelate ligase
VGADVEGATAVVRIDDIWGRRLAADRTLAAPVVTYGRDPQADVRATDIKLSSHGARFRAATPWGHQAVELALTGGFNIDNALAALAAACALGCSLEDAAAGLAQARSAPGRMEAVPNDRGMLVVVDYAHTEDALGKALQAAREVVSGRLITVFGCGGDRDRGKRSPMAAIAGQWSDFVVVTSDNPRTEDPEVIFRDMEAGFEPGQRFIRISDREAAIAYALRLAEEGDGVVIAGKGHETYQEIGHTMKPFDDRQVARQLLGMSRQEETYGAECG